MIDRLRASGLMPQPIANEIIKELPTSSAALRMFRRRTMTAATEDQPVLAALPTAGFTAGDLGHAPVTVAEWSGKRLKSEDLKCSVIVPNNVMRDSSFPMWEEIKPLIAEAMGVALDRAIFTGVGAPASFGGGIVPAALANNKVARGTTPAAKGGLYGDLIATMRKVVSNGYRVTGWAGSELFEMELMGATDTTGKTYADLNATQSLLLRRPLSFVTAAIWPEGPSLPEILCGDFTKAILGVRQEIEYQFVTEGVVSDPVTGAVLVNLPQQGATEMIVKARFAFVLANNATLLRPNKADEATRCPFAVLTSPAA